MIAYIQRVGDDAHKLCFVSATKFAQSNSCVNAHGWDLGGQVNWSPDGSTILVLGTKNHGNNFGLLTFSTSVRYSAQASNWSGRRRCRPTRRQPGRVCSRARSRRTAS